MKDETVRKLARITDLRASIKEMQDEVDALETELAQSNEAHVRTALARSLGKTTEALRLKYGAAPAVPVHDRRRR